jgi:hypothetical protein
MLRKLTLSPEIRAGLRTTIRQALMLRIAAAVAVHVFLPMGSLAPDELTYDDWSAWIARYWAGDTFIFPSRVGAADPAGFFYIVAAVYYLFGHWPLLAKLVNAITGAVSVALAFDIAMRVTGSDGAALRCARFVAFFPSMILWSVLLIRDTWVVLLVLLICRLALELQERPSPKSLLLLAAAIYAVTLFRSYILFAVTLPMLVSFVARRRRHLVRNTAIGMIVATVVIYADASAGLGRRMRTLDLEELNRSRQWSATAAASGFARDADISTPAKAIAFLPVGLTYFLLAPFPWTIVNFRQGFTIPETLFFYALLPAIFRGVFWLLRNRLGDSLMVILLSGGITLGYAVGQGNVGTIYRHRAQVLPFFLVFAAAGVEVKRRRRASTAVVGPSHRQPARLAT